MTKIKKLLSLAIIFLLLMISVFDVPNIKVSAAQKNIVHIYGTDVNFRTSKSSKDNSNVICKIDNDVAELISNDGSWLHIRYNYNGTLHEGYISANGLTHSTPWLRILSFDPDYRDWQFESQISAFPEDYKDSLRLLHFLYPNWKFTAYKVNQTIDQAVADQLPYLQANPNNSILRKYVSLTGHPVSWRSMGHGAYDWVKGDWANLDSGWTGASKEVVSYFMDPRNFLTGGKIFMYMKQTTDSTQAVKEDVDVIVNKSSFMKNGYATFVGDIYGGSYSNVFLAASQSSHVDPCVLAAVIYQEQGKGTSPLVTGTYGYYNFFNIGAFVSGGIDKITNGVNFAKTKGWDTIPKSIIGGATFLKEKYINGGQDTYFFQNFDLITGTLHQYATNVQDSYSKGYFVGVPYFSRFNYALEFKIPVYNDMPSTVYARPVENDKLNNYYIKNITIANNNLTPSFEMYKYDYALGVWGDTTLNVILPDTATLVSSPEYQLSSGTNYITLTVKAETGYTNSYNITVNANANCKLTINSNVNIDSTTYKLGDVNGDGKISISDIGNIRLHLLNRYALSGNYALAADVNKDGKISISDIGSIRLHLLGRYTIQ